MGQLTLSEKLKVWLKYLLFRVFCRLYLWSIGEKTLDSYLSKIESAGTKDFVEWFESNWDFKYSFAKGDLTSRYKTYLSSIGKETKE